MQNKQFLINNIIATTMDLYLQIQQCLREQKPLTNVISQIYTSLLPRRTFKSNGLTQQQCLSLVYEHMRAPLVKLKERVQNELKEQDNLTQEEQVQEERQREDEDDEVEQEEQESDHDGNEQEIYQQGQINEEELQPEAQEENDEEILDRDGNQMSEQDVGLYGEQIDEEDMQSYENEEMEDDPQFGNFNLNKMEDKAQVKKGEQEDEYIEENFDQFRQIQLKNQQTQNKEAPTEIEKQIEKFEERAMQSKNWILGGEVKAKERPVNSLIDTQLEYKSGIKYSHEITQSYNSSLEDIIKQRILDEIYDDRVRIIPNTSFIKPRWQKISTEKSSKGLAELYQIEFKNNLGIGDNKNEKLKKQIMDSFKEVNYYLDSLSNTGFSIKPSASIQKNGAEAIILEDKVPITNWNGGIQASKMRQTFESDKEINNKTKRLRNKRNARQRKKEQDRKKMHKSIEYGGMTKLEAEARKKIAKTKLDTKSVKYSKSSSFFSNINNKTKAGKPNPNISKLKI